MALFIMPFFKGNLPIDCRDPLLYSTCKDTNRMADNEISQENKKMNSESILGQACCLVTEVRCKFLLSLPFS